MSADALIEDFGRLIGMSMRLDENNLARLRFAETRDVDFEFLPNDDTLHLCTVVGSVHASGLAACRKMMAANLFGMGCGGNVLAFDAPHDEIVLYRTLTVSGLTAHVLAERLQTLLTAAEEWQQCLKNPAPPSEADQIGQASGDQASPDFKLGYREGFGAGLAASVQRGALAAGGVDASAPGVDGELRRRATDWFAMKA